MARASLLADQERRSLSLAAAQVQVRADDSGTERFDGHAAVFDTRTAIGNPLKWGFYEEIARGAFTKTLQEGDSRFLIDHDSFYVVARVSAGTLNLREDSVGLHVDSALDTELSYVKDLKINLRNKNITGMSFGFYVVRDDWNTETIETKDGMSVEVEVRIIQEVRLIEVSAVTFPAYEETDAGLRAALRSRGDVDAIRRRLDFDPELATLLDEPWAARKIRELQSQEQEETPAETTSPPENRTEDDAPAPAETTRVAPSEREMAAARMRVLRAQLRKPA
jgi:Escherichia/Staphylococcus phage prohead protease